MKTKYIAMKTSPPVFLVGPRCSGKTTVSELVAAEFGLDRFDTDDLVVAEAGLPVPEIVSREGWTGFRERESRALAAGARQGAIVATGGGVVLSLQNRTFMRSSGVVFYLAAPVQNLCERLFRDHAAHERPSLTGQDPVQEMAGVFAEREPLYLEAAHHRVDASVSACEVARAIIRVLEKTLRIPA